MEEIDINFTLHDLQTMMNRCIEDALPSEEQVLVFEWEINGKLIKISVGEDV